VRVGIAQEDGAAIHLKVAEESLIRQDAARSAREESNRWVVAEPQVPHEATLDMDIEGAGQRATHVYGDPVRRLTR